MGYKPKICPICGETFIPKSSKQKYCKKEIKKICPICKDEYVILCQPDKENPVTCSKPQCKRLAAKVGEQKKTKICRVCGQPFHPTSSRQMDCNKPVENICVVCGKTYIGKCSMNDTSTTCSPECSQKLASQHRIKSYQEETRICELCGKTFHPRSNTQKICDGIHYRKCAVCGKKFILDTSKRRADWPETCSHECAVKYRFRNGNPFQKIDLRKKALRNYKEKTGYDHPMHNPDVINKMKQTSINKYGDMFTRTEEYKKKSIETNRERYGADWFSQTPEYLNKTKATNIERYGAESIMKTPEGIKRMKSAYKAATGYESPAQNPDVIAKTKAHNLEKYGVEYAISSKEVREKSRQTMLERYGVTNPLKSERILKKVENTCLKKYGSKSYVSSKEGKKKLREYMMKTYHCDRYSKTREYKISMMKDPSKVDTWMRYLEDQENFIRSLDHQPTFHELANMCGVSETTISARSQSCIHLIKRTLSYMESDVYEFLSSIRPDLFIRRNVRNVLPNRELDIYIPELKLAIECNPTYTHNSSYPSFGETDNILPYSYHKEKTDMCEKQGIFLFHIFGYEWEHKRVIIESMLQNLLNCNTSKLFARKLNIMEVNSKDASIFLEENHRQGKAGSRIRLGLYNNDELVSLMTFGKMRHTVGRQNEAEWELIRFCNKLSTSVVGGASKLFRYFISMYHPQSILSFSDRAHTKGNLYRILGFHNIRTGDPSYVWVNTDDDKAYHRMNAQKRNIQKFLHDYDIDMSKSEKQIMEEHNFCQVFDSGTATWIWTNKSAGY